MDLRFDTSLVEGYESGSQKIRIMTEDWLARNLYCPVCGTPHLTHYEANRPVADFCCHKCGSDFELKSKESKSGRLGTRIADGAYSVMIERILSFNNPNFFFLTYSDNRVNNLVLVPNMFFTPDIIDKRKPLSSTAKRAGWVGCNINIAGIPESGKIFIIKDGRENSPSMVVEHYMTIKNLAINNIGARGWLMDILRCIDNIPEENFSLDEVYSFVDMLKELHPDNNNIHAKIRQQLQLLRDRGVIDFVSRGQYRKKILKYGCSAG